MLNGQHTYKIMLSAVAKLGPSQRVLGAGGGRKGPAEPEGKEVPPCEKG